MARAVVPRTAAAVDHADTELIGQSGRRISLWCFLLAFFVISTVGQPPTEKSFCISRFPLRESATSGKRVYEGNNDTDTPLLLYARPTSADLEALCRVSTEWGNLIPQ